MSAATWITGDTLTVLRRMPTNSVDLVLTSPPFPSDPPGGTELLAALAAVERLHLIGDGCHAFGDLWPTLGSGPASAPRLQVRLGDEDPATTPLEWDVAQLHGLHAGRVAAASTLARLGQCHHRLPRHHLGHHEGAATRRRVEVAELKHEIRLTPLDAQERTQRLQDPPARELCDRWCAGVVSNPPAEMPPGVMLLYVRDSVIEAIEYAPAILDDDEWHDMTHQIADQAPDVYTHNKWAEFVDLAAYNEDPSDLGAESDDMNKAASVCLYIIADRLAGALFQEIAEADNEPENDTDA